MLDASLIISEVMARNDELLLDEDGDSPDWFELLNISGETIDLNGWHVTDDVDHSNTWQFPPLTLNPGEHLIVFASGKDRDNPTRPLHTDFKLDGDGEYLALTGPEGAIEFEFAPQLPPQIDNVSYGVPNQVTQAFVVDEGAAALVHIPSDARLDPADLANDQIQGSWLDPNLDVNTGQWMEVTTGIGFRNEANDPNPRPGQGTLVASSTAEFSQFQNRDGWRYGYWNAAVDDDGIYSDGDFKSFVWSGLTTITAFNHWDGTKWDLAADPETPKTEITADGGHPSGEDSGTLQYAVRRWTSEVEGSVLIHGRLENADATGDGVIARIFVDGQEVYSRQLNGFGIDYQVVIAVQAGSKVDFVIDPGAAHQDLGDQTRFTATIEDVTALVGELGGVPTLADHIATDIEAAMKGVSSSAYVRIPFVPNSVTFDSMTLNVKYDDAFVAYLNGRPIASAGGPEPLNAVWNSSADDDRAVADALRNASFNVTSAIDSLMAGTQNVLMIQAINHSADNEDLLILPQLVATSLEVNATDRRYFVSPTPGTANGLGDANVGPVFVSQSFAPLEPTAADPIVVAARVSESFHAVADVSLTYRAMYGDSSTIPMLDDGTGNDTVGGDGVYTATIPAGLAEPGEMVRWFMTASDSQQQASRLPRFEIARDSEEYFGTVIVDPSLSSNLPIFHWFVQSRSRAFSTGGTQGSLYHDGEFYDNVTFDLHGQSSSGFPTSKKSMNVDFPQDHRFRLADDIPRMKDINLLTNFADKAKVRNTLAYEQRAFIGDAYHLAFPVRVQHNGDFFALYDFVEDGDDRWLERLGLDPEGALYKMYNRMDAASGEKKTRQDDSNNDLRDLVSGAGLSGQSRDQYIFDNIDLAAMANYLAGFVLTSNRDCCHKNYYAYRDTNGTGEWRYMAWDVDLSQGRNWGGFGLAYFDDTMYPDNDLFMGQNNRLISALYATPGFREMYLRRVRSVIDAYVKPPGTPYDELPLETRVDELLQLLADDAALDNQRHPAIWGQTGRQSFREAIEILKSEYAQPRREFLYQTQVMPDDSNVRVLVSGSRLETTLNYFVPSDNSLGTSWTQLEFDDSGWHQGPTGIGFENSASGAYDALIATDIASDMEGRTSAYVRIPFQLDSLEDLHQLTLRMKYDDGFIAYLNGTEVARRGVGADVPSYDMTSQAHSDALAVEYQNITITPFIEQLLVGDNVLAIQAVNASSTSSDMLMIPELVEGRIVESGGEIPTAQIGTPRIDFGEIDFNPLSGNQDEEYVQLTNNHAFAVDLSGWRLTEGIELTFKPGTVLPAGWSMFVTPNARAFRARQTGPRGGQQLFVQGNYAGHLSNLGETIHLVGDNGELVNSFSYDGLPTELQQHLHVTELMYHPAAPSAAETAQNARWTESDFEFIELMNTSNDVKLNLTGVRLTDGVEFDFANSQVTSLAAQQRVLVVANAAAFEARYGSARSALVAGEFASASGLRDSGETLKLEDDTNSTIVEFQYSDDHDRGWAYRADGRGSSLEVVDFSVDYSAPENWRASDRIHGTPGTAPESIALQVQINEVVSRSNDPQVDAVEIHNRSSRPVLLEHYYLSDSPADADSWGRFLLPTTELAAGGFLVLDEGDFNPSDQPRGFALSGSRGDELYLTVGDASGPTHFVDDVRFPAAALGESFGRVAGGPLAPLQAITLGSPNSPYRVGPVLITEFNYHPSEPTAAALSLVPELQDDDLEFIEIHNSSGQSVDLSGWRLRGDIDYEFDSGTSLAPSETILVLPFNPARPDNESRRSAFLTHYGISAATRFVGGYGGQLDNGGQRISLQRPGTAPAEEPDFIPRLWEDEVRFDDLAPWPTSADGQGESLQRTSAAALGLLVESWHAAPPTPGQVDLGDLPGDFNSDGALDIVDIDHFSTLFRLTPPDLTIDLTGDDQVNDDDRDHLIEKLFGTTYGDSDLDGIFNSTDLILIFRVGEYEDGIDGNSSWSDGDWNMDGDFATSDLVLAFAAGGYSVGARARTAFSSPADVAAAIQFHDAVFADEDEVFAIRR